jgi:glycosyltransferase involved in cell wall biosynthesis
MRVAYLIPEFPGQTHIWMWRERTHLIESGLDVPLLSTRPPPERDRARHAFADQARAQTFYLWPMPIAELLIAAIDLVSRRIFRLAAMLRLCDRIARDDGPPRRQTVRLIPAAWRMARWIARERVEHVHVATPAGSLITALLARKLAPFTIDVVVNANFNWWGGALTTKFRGCDAVIVITDWMLRHVRETYPPDIVAKTALARIGVDTRSWTQRTPPPHSDTLRVATVGRLHRSKGHDDLIRAVALLTQRSRAVRLTIMGDGPERAELQSLAAQLGLAESVQFTGSLAEDRVRANLAGADVFVGASHAEPLGVVYMEAMALGVPTIGTDAGGVPEIIEHGVSGLLVPPKNPEAIADALERLAAEPGLAERLGAAGRARIVERFDSRIGAAEVRAIIDRCRQRPSG